MRRRHNIHHSDTVRKIDDTTISNRQKAKKKWLKPLLASIATVLVLIIAYEGYSFFKAANNILDSNVSFSDIKNFVSASKSSLKETDGITNILILGKGGENHPGGNLTDTIQVLMLNHSDKKVAMVSIPRDLKITYSGGTINKINYAYTAGYEKEKDKNKKNEAGIKSAEETVTKVIGVPIHYYISLDFIGFKELVDALGGVTVNVAKDLSDPYYPKDYFTSNGSYVKTDAYSPLYIKAGKQNMNGELALKYARSRETTSDFDRARRQQEILFAVKEKALSLGVLANPKRVSDMISSVGNHVKTDLGLSEIKELVETISSLEQSSMINKVIDNNAKDGLLVSTSEGGYYLVPKAGVNNYSQIQALVKGIFSTDSGQSSVDSIQVYNGSGVAGRGGAVAQKLKDLGLTIDTIDTYSTEIPSTKIIDGTGDTATLTKIKSVIGEAKTETNGAKGVIKIIIGQDYGK